MWPWRDIRLYQMAAEWKTKSEVRRSAHDGQLLLQRAFPLSPRDRPPVWAHCCPEDSAGRSGHVTKFWPRRGRTHFWKGSQGGGEKKKKGGGGEWSSHSLGQPALQSVGRTSPRPVWPPSWGPCPIPTRSPRHAGASGLIAHTQGLQGPDTSWTRFRIWLFSTALRFIYGYVAKQSGWAT